MTENEMRHLIERYIEAYNAFDVEGMLALMTDDIVFENHSDGVKNLTARGVDELRKVGARTSGIFSAREQKVKNISFELESAVIDVDYAATLATDLADGQKEGDTVAFEGRSIFIFRDGRIAALADYA